MADVILVDDSPDVQDVLSDFLRGEGHRVRVAGDGLAGLRLVDERIPELALLDVEMPELSGPDMAYGMFVADLGRERVPIIFLSGAADLPLIAASVGTSYYLAKPFSLRALREVLGRALGERASPTYPRAREARR